jgi:hypothetical protein
MAQTRTSDQIVTNALTRIGAASVGQTPSDEDMAVCKARLEEILADFAERGVVYVGDVDEVPLSVALHLEHALAVHLSDFGPLPSDLPPLSSTESRLRQISSVAASREPVRADYF